MPQRDPATEVDSVDLAHDRTMLAAERTLAAWWRTAMAALAGAVGFVRLFGDVQPQWVIRGGATLLIALALVILFVAYGRYRRTSRRINNEEVRSLSVWSLAAGTGLLVLAAGVAGAVTWLF
ncbi:YidH family protein [Microvirga sp. GCM10011540]|uniref:YidH family protein n=1 Tax=Microvirga sp. GCM10011540 TaxID=3317338 RepID=UPI00360E14FB